MKNCCSSAGNQTEETSERANLQTQFFMHRYLRKCDLSLGKRTEQEYLMQIRLKPKDRYEIGICQSITLMTQL